MYKTTTIRGFPNTPVPAKIGFSRFVVAVRRDEKIKLPPFTDNGDDGAKTRPARNPTLPTTRETVRENNAMVST